MTPKQNRLNSIRKAQLIVRTRRIIFGIVYLSLAIGAIAFILGALQ